MTLEIISEAANTVFSATHGTWVITCWEYLDDAEQWKSRADHVAALSGAGEREIEGRGDNGTTVKETQKSKMGRCVNKIEP